MVFRGLLGATRYTFSLRNASLTIAVGDEEVVAIDRGGRLYSVWTPGDTYRRALNGRVLHKWQRDGSRGRRSLPPEACDALMAQVAARADAVLAGLSSHGWRWETAPDPVARTGIVAVLGRAAGFDAAAAREDAARFRSVYSPVGILPPDQYLALVLQATEGCSFGSCTFCDLYPNPYRVRTVEEFRQHGAKVRNYLGESLALRDRSIFLGAANALAVPTARLLPLFDVLAGDWNAGPSRRPVYAFVDAFTGTRKSEDEYRLLASRGLARVYIGLESGHDPLLSFIRKPGTARDAIETVRTLKSAGIGVGVIVMIGLGGDRFTEGHVRDTVAVVNEMDAGAGDIVYFSDLVEMPGTEYPRAAAAAGIRALTADERGEQRARIRAGLVFRGVPPQIATYDVFEFVY